MRFLKRLVYSTMVFTILTSPALKPAFALDYEAKPVNNVITAPFHIVGAVSGAATCGLFSGPVDGSFHQAKKTTSKIAGALGDENGKLQIITAAPIAVPLGLVVGGAKGFVKGTVHGAKAGWNKPFSRWSFVTTEEEEGKK